MNQKNIVLATNNAGKLHEFKILFKSLKTLSIIAQTDFQVSSVEETGSTFVENAILKARHACLHTKLPAIADDSGLVVDALQGKPGVFSARYAGEKASDAENIKKLLLSLKSVPIENRAARFCCVLVYLSHADDPLPLIAKGSWEGTILSSPTGKDGFGYDPIFYVPTHHLSAAQLPIEIKNQLSHRGQAMRKLVQLLTQKIHHA